MLWSLLYERPFSSPVVNSSEDFQYSYEGDNRLFVIPVEDVVAVIRKVKN